MMGGLDIVFSFQNLQRFKCLHRTEPDLRFAPWAPNTVSQWQWGSLEERNFVFLKYGILDDMMNMMQN